MNIMLSFISTYSEHHSLLSSQSTTYLLTCTSWLLMGTIPYDSYYFHPLPLCLNIPITLSLQAIDTFIGTSSFWTLSTFTCARRTTSMLDSSRFHHFQLSTSTFRITCSLWILPLASKWPITFWTTDLVDMWKVRTELTSLLLKICTLLIDNIMHFLINNFSCNTFIILIFDKYKNVKLTNWIDEDDIRRGLLFE